MSSLQPATAIILGLAVIPLLSGCRQQAAAPKPNLTATQVRSDRRAYDGAPPVIPHEPFGAACVTCHTKTGKLVPNRTFAPANPHADRGQLSNCRQCHLFRRATELFAESDFQPQAVTLRQGSRLFPGAPPTIPHETAMRENCLGCHDGPAARPEIRCSHPQRVHCVQCHVAQHAAPDFASVE